MALLQICGPGSHEGADGSLARGVDTEGGSPPLTLATEAARSTSECAAASTAPLAAFSIRVATDCGCDTKTEWLLLTSTIIAPARFAICRWASGGIILSSVVTRYQLGFAFHAGSLIVPFRAFTPHGTCESAMNAAFSGLTSPAKNAGNLALSNSK